MYPNRDLLVEATKLEIELDAAVHYSVEEQNLLQKYEALTKDENLSSFECHDPHRETDYGDDSDFDESDIVTNYDFPNSWGDVESMYNVGHSQSIIETQDGKFFYKFCDKITPEGYDEIRTPEFVAWGWLQVCLNGQWGYLDGNLNFTTDVSQAHEYVVRAEKFHGQEEFIPSKDPLGRDQIQKLTIIDNACRSIMSVNPTGSFHSLRPYKVFEHNGKFGVADFLDFPVIDALYDAVLCVSGMFVGCKDGLWAVLAKSGLVGYLQPYKELHWFSEEPPTPLYKNVWRARKNGSYGLYDFLSGKWILQPVFSEVTWESDGRIHADGKWGFYNGNILIHPVYDNIFVGRCLCFLRAELNGVIGYIDEAQNWTPLLSKAYFFTCNKNYWSSLEAKLRKGGIRYTAPDCFCLPQERCDHTGRWCPSLAAKSLKHNLPF